MEQVLSRPVGALARYGDSALTTGAERAVAAMQMQQKVIIESRLAVAMKIGRDDDYVRMVVEKLCLDPDFATEALYAKPISRAPDEFANLSKRDQLIKAPEEWPRGFSIRFIEAAIQAAGHFDCSSIVVHNSADEIITLVTVWDMVTNNADHRMVTTPKTIERKKLKKGQVPMGERSNTYGETIFILPATPAEVETMRMADISKAKRTLAEHMFPAGDRRIWRDRIEETIRADAARDPEGAKKKLLSTFFTYGITPEMVQEYLDLPNLDFIPVKEVVTLRALVVLISTGEYTWAEIMRDKRGELEEETSNSIQKAVQDRIKVQMEKNSAGGNGADPAPAAAREPMKEPEPVKEPEPDTKLPWRNKAEMDNAFLGMMQNLGKNRFDAVCRERGIQFHKVRMSAEAADLYAAMEKVASTPEPSDPRQPLRDLCAKVGEALFYEALGHAGAASIEDVPVASVLKVVQVMQEMFDQLNAAPEPAPEKKGPKGRF